MALVALLTAAAWGTWTYAVPHTAVIPAIAGELVDRAIDRLTTLGFEVQVVDGAYHLRCDPPITSCTSGPPPGKERDVGSTVTIVPSLGPPPVKVPAVIGDPLQDARRAIAAAGLHVEAVRHRFDAEVLEDHVIAVRPDRVKLPQGTSVTLIVSDGPKPVPVPDVSGMTEDRAVQALADFDVVIEEVFSARVDRGRAIGTDPGERDGGPTRRVDHAGRNVPADSSSSPPPTSWA